MDLYQEQYDTRSSTPAYWHNKSHDLFVSGYTLWKGMQVNSDLEINCLATYKMLMGMSFELLFKAHCIGAGISFGTNHDLVALARTATFTTSREENRILKVLSEYVIWDGRYPTPKQPEHLKGHWQNQNKVSDEKLDFENIHSFWRKFSDSFIGKYN